jgi:hypothetical protein
MFLGPVGDSREAWPMSAIFDGHFQGRGTLAEPVGSGYASFAKLDWGGTSLGPVAVDMTLADGAALFDVDLRELSMEMAASVRLHAPRTFDVVVDARDTDVSRLVRKTGRQGPRSRQRHRCGGFRGDRLAGASDAHRSGNA